VSIIRVGLSETKHFADGYDAIFGKKKESQANKKPARPKKSGTTRRKVKKK